MPFYNYKCSACGHALEVLQKLSSPVLTDCPECSEPKLVKQVSAPSFRLKGSGWYETDFKSDNRKNLVDYGDKAADNKGDGGTDRPPEGGAAEGSGAAKKDAKAEQRSTKDDSAKSKGADTSAASSADSSGSSA